MLYVINLAKELFFSNKRRWNQLIERGMNKNFSWNASKQRYEELYNHLIQVRANELKMMEEARKQAEAEAKEAEEAEEE